MWGFNQSEWIFLIWIVVASNKISVSFYGLLIEKSCQPEVKLHFGYCHFNHKISFCSSCRIQSEELFEDLNLSNKKKYTKAIAKLNDQNCLL